MPAMAHKEIAYGPHKYLTFHINRHSRLTSIVFMLVPLHKTRCGPNNLWAASILFPHRRMIRPNPHYS